MTVGLTIRIPPRLAQRRVGCRRNICDAVSAIMASGTSARPESQPARSRVCVSATTPSLSGAARPDWS